MSGTKAALKAINAAVQSQKYDEAVEQAQKLLDSDPNSYQAQGGGATGMARSHSIVREAGRSQG
ncbi:hypothetical protein BofuT4_uP067300.1 [Botrytis cinerea T4]|uniref:Uncharacterized protein n=1 Tax=Botryotinia fuckeliana (strain T4) TaxID=999810 RepID=G2XRF4_BOTF4|nr:hypothetical protein BofuT4_uP067300.1 [Botrytis cinerea T4]